MVKKKKLKKKDTIISQEEYNSFFKLKKERGVCFFTSKITVSIFEMHLETVQITIDIGN